ncbi:DUF4864 domain-containing protein [Algihabitans sp.]|uniref:DUF4864 domain-containing protein n=1 Tax=Algihabitans sp. TaxID=2821514 RepID=UPI003BA97924
MKKDWGHSFMPSRFAVFVLAILMTAGGFAPGPGPAQAESTVASAAAIRLVIESQLEAFRRDDGAEAFSYASPSIQRRFRSAEVFMQMVQTGYPQVYRPRSVEFEDLDFAEDRAVQGIFLVGPDGRGARALYFMEMQPNGGWKIDGVQLQLLPETTT